jgi:hypothetical protein
LALGRKGLPHTTLPYSDAISKDPFNRHNLLFKRLQMIVNAFPFFPDEMLLFRLLWAGKDTPSGLPKSQVMERFYEVSKPGASGLT